MKKYLNKNENQISDNLQDVENTLASLSVRDIAAPYMHFESISQPVISIYTNLFDSISLGQRRILSVMMSVPALALIFTFSFWAFDDSGEIYLASNDVSVIEESNTKIIDKINSLENINTNLYDK
jgi:hypothetical protein